MSFVFTRLCSSPLFPWASFGRPGSCSSVRVAQRPVARRTQQLPAGVSARRLLRWPYTNFRGAAPLVGGSPLLWLASLAKSPEAEVPVLAKVSSFASLCVHPRRAFLACWFQRNFLACQPLLQSLVDQNSTRIFSAQWISLVVEAESWSC